MPGAFRASAGSLQHLQSLGRGRPDLLARPGRRTGEQGPDAERRAQQERMYMLDYNKVMAGAQPALHLTREATKGTPRTRPRAITGP